MDDPEAQAFGSFFYLKWLIILIYLRVKNSWPCLWSRGMYKIFIYVIICTLDLFTTVALTSAERGI